jgi:hypothetical protein
LVEFYHDGHTQKECGVRFGVSKSTVLRHFKAHPEIPRRKPMEKAEKARDPALAQRFIEKEEAARKADMQIEPGRPSPRKKRTIIKLEDYEL